MKEHRLSYEKQAWICEETGLPVPKKLQDNIKARQKIYESAKNDKAIQDYWLECCAKSPVLWLNLFGWTYRIKEVNKTGKEVPAKINHYPFITWPVQDEAIFAIVNGIDHGGDVLIDKSRDMGASWLVVSVAWWLWRFRENTHGLMSSRIEDLVDKRGDPDTLFWKLDYHTSRVPEWMCPNNNAETHLPDGQNRSHMLLINQENKNTITGSAATAHVGRGGRRAYVLFDEMAACPHARLAWQAAADTTACRVANSTPLGPGTEFTRLRNTGIMTDSPKVVTLGYWDHPEKGFGRKKLIDETGDVTNMAGRVFWHTPYLEAEIQRRANPQDIGQNLLIDHITSGDIFFNSTDVTRHLQTHARQSLRCELVPTGKSGAHFEEDSKGRWYVWASLVKGEPTNETNYAMFADLAHGTGAANTALAVMDRMTGQIVAEFVDPNTSTFEFAEEACLAGKTVFAGDSNEAFFGWETNGPGEAFYEDMKRNAYKAVYFRRTLGQRRTKRKRDYGWRSDRKSKRILLSALSRAITREEIIIPSRAGLEELLQYVFYDDGSIGPGHLQDETTGAREAHGDRVIAYAGAVLMRAEAPKFEEGDKTFPKWSYGDIMGHNEVWENL